MLIEANEVNRLDPKQVAILCTGSQGEPMAALARLASGNYRQVDILPEDTVIIAATLSQEMNVTFLELSIIYLH